MKRCLTSLAIREMQNKTMVRYLYTSTRMSKIEKIPYRVLESMQSNWNFMLVWAQNGTATLNNSLSVSYKVKRPLTTWPNNPTPYCKQDLLPYESQDLSVGPGPFLNLFLYPQLYSTQDLPSKALGHLSSSFSFCFLLVCIKLLLFSEQDCWARRESIDVLF